MSPAQAPTVPAARRACHAVPGHNARMHAKALASGADEVVLDLEDAVAPDAKERARDVIAATLADPAWTGATVAVRVNARDTPWHEDDLAWVATLPTAARLSIVVPKVQSPADVRAVADALAAAGAPADLAVQALLETPTAIADARAIAAVRGRLATLIIGFADLATALGRRGAQNDPSTWLPAQEAVLAAAREHGLQAIDGPHLTLGDPSSLAEAALRARDLGFDGKWAIHPEQVPVLVRTFRPSSAEVAHARATLAALDAAATVGDAAVRVSGQMVDEAHRDHAARVLAGSGDGPPGEEPIADVIPVALPYYEDLSVGDVFTAPGMTLDAGLATLHRSIVGDRLALALDAPLAREVTGMGAALAHPMLVCDVAIGQSTAPSARVLGNLFYRGLAVRPVPLGTTLRTRTEIVAKRRAKTAGGGSPRGLVVLRVTTTDEHGDAVVDFHRCPLLPARADRPDEPGDDLGAIPADLDDARVTALVPADWSLAPLRALGGPLATNVRAGAVFAIEARETVTAAPELARVTLNQALTHTDAGGSHHGRRLVYGGQVIGIAAAHVTRVFPSVATILAWRSCDHLGPTFEGDRLATTVEIERVTPLADGALLDLRARVAVDRGDAGSTPVLDWRLVALLP
ncbi:MAG: hypothetical protein JWM93_1487 [Frankiales bacterium]|nr:hypothetical protein [Frankiales bacterium]